MSAMVISESIKTTEQKAKAIKGGLEKLVTKVKKHGVNSSRLLGKFLTPLAAQKMISDVALRFIKRKGGYTRIVKLGRRFNDDASMVLLEWVEKGQTEQGEQKLEVSRTEDEVSEGKTKKKKETQKKELKKAK